ncbi:MAG: hypothetical protein MJ025_00600 [Victivallaceae bacterium]|nr:hypothetical protein [Victivallaceae bacterium]
MADVLFSLAWIGLEAGTEVTYGDATYTLGTDAFFNLADAAEAAGGVENVTICDKFYLQGLDTTKETAEVVIDGCTISLAVGTQVFDTLGKARTAAGTATAFVDLGESYSPTGNTRRCDTDGDGQTLVYHGVTYNYSGSGNNSLVTGDRTAKYVITGKSSIDRFNTLQDNYANRKETTIVVDDSYVADLRGNGEIDAANLPYTYNEETGVITWNDDDSHTKVNMTIQNGSSVGAIYMGPAGSVMGHECTIDVIGSSVGKICAATVLWNARRQLVQCDDHELGMQQSRR